MRFRENIRIIASGLIFAFMIVGPIYALAFYMDSISCVEKWKKSGLTSSYSIVSGCTVEIRNGVWVPQSSIKFNKE